MDHLAVLETEDLADLGKEDSATVMDQSVLLVERSQGPSHLLEQPMVMGLDPWHFEATGQGPRSVVVVQQ